jgi:hypothetical protein
MKKKTKTKKPSTTHNNEKLSIYVLIYGITEPALWNNLH